MQWLSNTHAANSDGVRVEQPAGDEPSRLRLMRQLAWAGPLQRTHKAHKYRCK